MPNKEMNRAQVVEVKATAPPAQHGSASKPATSTTKAVVSKPVKDAAMSPGAPSTPAAVDPERTELLGSLTTQQQQRTSARVIKKLRLEPPGVGDKRVVKKDGVDDLHECETPIKIDEKDLKFPTVKQRMPKALWSTDEKNLFFEALNEYGKDFDAITAYICAKMKKKGMPDNLKTKTQVSHFYYRTWHKLSKHVHFDENVKKVAQELYALINYGELRKKLVSVSEKTCARLGEMVLCGSIVVRARGRNLRVRTPMCRALRCLNQITELACGARVCSRAQVLLRARDAAAWARVQGAAHNPRAAVTLPLRARLQALLRALQLRWGGNSKQEKLAEALEDNQKEVEDYEVSTSELEQNRELEDHLHLETDRIILQDHKGSKKLALHCGPRPGADVQLPVVGPSEQLSSQKICFSSYLERMGSLTDKHGNAKIRTPKRQRKDSTTEKEKEADPKKLKMDEHLVNIEESAIDGIELMASYKSHQEDEEKPSTEDEIVEQDGDRYLPERDKESLERDKDMSEREKDSFSEMEDDEKYNKSDTDNESDHGKDKNGKDTKFKNLKVKFRIRPKKRGGSIYTLVMNNPDELKGDELKAEDPKTDEQAKEEPAKEEPVKEDEVKEEAKADIDVDMAMRQIRKGWSVYDAGELTIGDLYLMFGSRSKLELDYWWAEPTPPLPQPKSVLLTPNPLLEKKPEKPFETDKKTEKLSESDKKSDKGDSSVEDERDKNRESDNDMLSPKYHSQDSNDGMSGDERKSEQLASPDHKSSSSSSLKLVSKLINRPQAPATNSNGFNQLSDRMRRLLSLVGNPHVSACSPIARCTCGHVCAQQRRQQIQQKPQLPTPQYSQATGLNDTGTMFRHPIPIAPRPDANLPKHNFNLDGVPPWRRGRPRGTSRRVVVQRLLPLLPKLPPHNLIPVKKVVPNSPPALPRLLPKPPHTSTSDLSFFYVLSESNGQFFFHDGDRRIPITPLPGNGSTDPLTDGEETSEETETNGIKTEVTAGSEAAEKVDSGAEAADGGRTEPGDGGLKSEEGDMAPEFLPSESLSLSPSRLLHGGWLEGEVPDFSLSSFLGQLDARPPPDLAVDSHLQSLMAESSVDYVAKFADLAAEVTDEPDLPPDDLT